MAWYEIVELVLKIMGLVGALIPTIISIVTLVKTIIKDKNWKLIEKIALAAMSEIEEYAQEHPEMSSDDKLNMCLEAIEAGLAEADIKVDTDLIKQIIAYIEEMCKWSKTVNTDVK